LGKRCPHNYRCSGKAMMKTSWLRRQTVRKSQ